jgi:hypothetical protein
MVTQTCKKWVAQATKLGFTLEQNSGIAMLYAWSSTDTKILETY